MCKCAANGCELTRVEQIVAWQAEAKACDSEPDG